MAAETDITKVPLENKKIGIDGNDLFEKTMKGQWKEVVELYEKNPEIQAHKITNSGDTVLHIAVADGRHDIGLKLVEGMRDAPNILKQKNKAGNTALHLAAALGNAALCQSMVSKDPQLVADCNNEKQTPLFLAALHGMEATFLCLQSHDSDQKIGSSRRENYGDTILHADISGEHFNLAFQILHYYPKDLVNFVDEKGLTPLHILASKPNAFKSSYRLGLFDSIIYYCIFVDKLKKEKYDHEARNGLKFIKLIRNSIRELRRCPINLFVYPAKTQGKEDDEENPQAKTQGKADDEENPQHKSSTPQGGTALASSSSATDSKSITKSSDAIKGSKDGQPMKEDEEEPNYAKRVVFYFKVVMHALLIVFGLGIRRIKNIKEKKETHKWANQVMNELVESDSSYKFGDNINGREPQNYSSGEDEDNLAYLEPSDLDSDEKRNGKRGTEKMEKPILLGAKMGVTEMVDRFFNSYPAVVQELNTSEKNLVLLTFDKKNAEQTGRKETPILIAAKMGVTEMVEKILDKFPVAIRDLDSDKKNVALLAIEYRQTRILKLLLNGKNLGESIFWQVDNQGNSALHLAAKFREHRPWLIPGAALQMQWEIKWFEFVKKSMSRHLFIRNNNEGKTPKEMFTETHENVVKEGKEWMTKTSESCSVVAALIAAVAFATSATVPGGVDQASGKPILENQLAFNIFAISSLVALCFSVTALVFFLTILTSRYQEKDFANNLPRKLLLGLTTLFTSIAAVLVSFCSGHSFILADKIRSAAYPIYAATCLPMTIFALAQLPLYFDLMWAIFTSVPKLSHEVISD